MSNLDKLVAAGCADATKMTPSDKAAVETLTDDEVDALISAQQKIGAANIKRLNSAGNFMV